MAEAAYAGYLRPDGRFGIRNRVLVLGINGLVARAAARIADLVAGSVVFASSYGRGQYGRDRDVHLAQLVGLGRNPNVAATLVVGADRATADDVAHRIADAGKPVAVATLDDVHEDALELTVRGARAAAMLARDASRLRRQAAPASSLFVGIECGHSDATSGLAANPLAGAVADRIVDAGGSVVFGETIEWLGAEHLLAQRARDASVREAIVAAVARRERAVAEAGVDLLGNNPGAENIRGGLSSIEEKSLGAIVKGGSHAIAGVLDVAAPPPGPGAYVMDGPSFSPESMTGFVAAGVQAIVFTAGAGNSYASAIAPTIKVSARPQTLETLPTQIDFDASAIFAGTEDVPGAAARLHALLLDVCAGTRTWGELLGEGMESVARVGGSL